MPRDAENPPQTGLSVALPTLIGSEIQARCNPPLTCAFLRIDGALILSSAELRVITKILKLKRDAIFC
jgi:hypothetical protein